MRVISGLLALLLGAVALVSGIGLQTFWAPPPSLTAEVDQAPEAAPLTLITGAFAQVDEEPVEYTLTGEGDYTVMLGREQDIRAWIGDAAVNEVTGITTDGADRNAPVVQIQHTDGAAEVPNPAGSDLWMETYQVSGELNQRWTLPEEEQTALLVAVDGTQPAPTDLSVTWTNRAEDNPWICPLIIGGSILLLLGVALLIWAFVRRGRGDRSGGGRAVSTDPARRRTVGAAGTGASTGSGSSVAPRVRSARGPVRGAVAATAAAALLGGVAVAGPAVAVQPVSPSPGEASSQVPDDAELPYPVVVEGQLDRILGQVAETVSEADEAQDAAALEPRVAGAALTLRALNYRNRGLDDSLQPAAPVSAQEVLSVVAPRSAAFPRTLMVATQGEGEATPQLLVLRQDSAREQYRLIHQAPLTPGASVDGFTLDQSGAQTIDPADGEGLLLSAEAALDRMANTFMGNEEAAASVVENPLIAGVRDYQRSVIEGAEDATVSFNRQLEAAETTALRLPDGSAMVFGTVDANVNSRAAEEGATVIASDLVAAVAGEDSTETTTAVYMRYREQYAVHVPAEGQGEQIALVGFDDELSLASYAD